MRRALCLVIGLALLVQALALSATLVSVNITVVDDSGHPVQGASVTLAASGGATFTATSDSAGKASLNVLPGSYTIVVSLRGYSMKTATLQITADAVQTGIVQLRRTGEGRVATANPPPAPAPDSKPGEGTVRDAVVAGYNTMHPEHKRGTPYFGRYTYVLLRDNGARSKALVTALVQKFSSDGSIAVGPPTSMDNPWGYNLFLLPLKNVKIPAGSLDAAKTLHYYDFAGAKNLRDRYCDVAKHAHYSLCKAPYDNGPLVLTFLRPVSELKKSDPLPPALAYDFTGIPETQFAVTIGKLQQTVSVAAPIQNDTLLPPPVLSKYVAPLLAEITNGLTALIPKLKVFHDGGILP